MENVIRYENYQVISLEYQDQPTLSIRRQKAVQVEQASNARFLSFSRQSSFNRLLQPIWVPSALSSRYSRFMERHRMMMTWRTDLLSICSQ